MRGNRLPWYGSLIRCAAKDRTRTRSETVPCERCRFFISLSESPERQEEKLDSPRPVATAGQAEAEQGAAEQSQTGRLGDQNGCHAARPGSGPKVFWTRKCG